MKYTTPLQRSFSIYVYNEKRYVGGLYTSLFCAIIPTLFPYFLPFWYPYILLHFQMFFITCSCLFFLAAAHAICHHRAEVGVLTGSRSPCFGIWTILTPVFTLAEEIRPKSTLFWMDTKAVTSNPCLNSEDHNIISYTRSSKIYIVESLDRHSALSQNTVGSNIHKLYAE